MMWIIIDLIQTLYSNWFHIFIVRCYIIFSKKFLFLLLFSKGMSILILMEIFFIFKTLCYLKRICNCNFTFFIFYLNIIIFLLVLVFMILLIFIYILFTFIFYNLIFIIFNLLSLAFSYTLSFLDWFKFLFRINWWSMIR